MTEQLTIIPRPITPAGTRPQANPVAGARSTAGQFEQQLQKAQQPSQVRFSGHAQDRMRQRGINFNPGQLERLQQALHRVDAKGGRDSLVMLDETALVVSVKNSTVVTVADRDQLQQNVFTNIDSAIIA